MSETSTKDAPEPEQQAAQSSAAGEAAGPQRAAGAPDLSNVDPATVDPASIDATAVDALDFANMVRNASDEQLAAGLAAGREIILGEVFRRMAEHLDPVLADGLDAVVDWHITGREDGGYDRFQVAIRNGTCEVSRDGAETPRATLELPAISFLRVATGNLFGAAVYLSGELRVEGDLPFAMQMQSYFRIPQPTAGA
ncbi:MAG: SCP2 sterol-binding domain-containing protein [Acidobacteriota bacterium]|nr:SCP2 sterol-binding domain-containing protein [Acidobacteriota bacterium]